jgi:hypothetical protein
VREASKLRHTTLETINFEKISPKM